MALYKLDYYYAFVWRLSDVCRVHLANREAYRKTKIGTEIAHVTCDSNTTFKVKKVKGQLVADVLNSQHSGTTATWRINTKILSTCRGRRHIVATARLQLVIIMMPRPGGIKWWCCLTSDVCQSVCRVHRA